MTDLRQAAEQALEALEEINKLSVGEKAICLPAEIDDAMEALRQALAESDHICDVTKKIDQGIEKTDALLAEIQQLRQALNETPPCKTHPDAPHGFDRNASHSADRYVCECEGWEPPQKEEGCAQCGKQASQGWALYCVECAGGQKWVGLTHEEKQAERHKLDLTAGWTYDNFARAIEAKLKEKNGG